MLEFPTMILLSVYILFFLYGITIGSFVNVLALRIPRKENFVKKRSHCEDCGYELQWYDLIPVFSYICLGGRCRKCKAKISVQHLVIEVLNGLLYIIVFWKYQFSIESILFCLMASALVGLSLIDFKTYEIPVGFNYFIAGLGIVRICFRISEWKEFVIGFFAVSIFLYILFIVSKGAAIGGGDVKLMAASGLLLGWKLNVFAFVVGCVLGSIIHSIRMKYSNEDRVLAMGPYLSAGILIAVLVGDLFIKWYSGFFIA